MRVFVAGGSGAVGRRLVPRLVERGHQVTATTTSEGRLAELRSLGTDAVLMDGLDAASVGQAVAAARPHAIVHMMTAIAPGHAGKPDLKHIGRWFGPTSRLRTEGTDHLLAAAEAAGVTNVVAQSYGAWNGIREGGWVKTEDDPLDPLTGTAAESVMDAVLYLESAIGRFGGAALRFGGLYGPGAIDDQAELVRRRQYPVVGDGQGHSSLLHLDDAAGATVAAVEQNAEGVFNVGDDEPAAAADWVTWLARCAGAKPPLRIPAWVARPLAGDVAVIMMTEGRAFSNAKAKRELGWRPQYPSWRAGFEAELA